MTNAQRLGRVNGPPAALLERAPALPCPAKGATPRPLAAPGVALVLQGEVAAALLCAPPFALERLEQLAEGQLVYRFPRPQPDGRTELRLTPLELLERLAALLAPPRLPRQRYHGMLAPLQVCNGGFPARTLVWSMTETSRYGTLSITANLGQAPS